MSTRPNLENFQLPAVPANMTSEPEFTVGSPIRDITLTENKQGFMIRNLDEYCRDFVDRVDRVEKPVLVGDFGVAFGYTTKLLLQNGADVIANDLYQEHLDTLFESLDENERKHVKLIPGNVLDLDLEPGSLQGILACRWIHFLTGDQLRTVLAKFHTWLAPDGLLTLTAESVHLGSHKEVFHKYLVRRANGEEWPGFVEVKDLSTKRKEHMPEHLMLYDTDVLTRELVRAKFRVVKCDYIARPYYPADLRNDGREAIGMTARKL